MNNWLVPSLAALLFWGLWSFIPKITTQYIHPKSAILFEVLGGLVIAFIVLVSLDFKIDIHPKGMILAMVTGALGFSGALCFLYAASKGPISLVSVVSALYPVIAILFGIFFLNESLSVKQGLGIILGLGAVVLIAT
jgi:transporter family protein